MSDRKDDAAEVVRDFREVVNMSPAELRKWLDTDDSRSVGWTNEGESESVGHGMGGHIVRLLENGASGRSEEDLAHMRKVVGYVRRHMAQGGPEEDKEHSRWRYSLMNWGHDPMKGDKPVPKRRAPARKTAMSGGTGRKTPGAGASRAAAVRKPAARKAAAKPAAKQASARSGTKAAATRKAPPRSAAKPATKTTATRKAAPAKKAASKRTAPAKAPARKAAAKPAAKKALPKTRAVSTKGPAKGLRPGSRAAQSALGKKGAAVRRGAKKD